MVCGAVSSSATADMGASIRLRRNLGSRAARHNDKSANDSFLLPKSRRDIAAVYRRDIAGGFQLQRLMQEGLGDVFGGDLAAKQVAAHVFGFRYTARLGPRRDEVIGE